VIAAQGDAIDEIAPQMNEVGDIAAQVDVIDEIAP
jgi:hypothetical protein